MASLTRHLAVDVGGSCLRMVALAPDGRGRPSVVGLAEVELAGDVSKPGELFPLLVAGFQQGLGQLPGRHRDAIFTLGGPAVFTRLIKIPQASPGKLDQLIQFEAQQTVPAIEQALWDFQILPSVDPGTVEVMLLAIKKETVEEITAAAAAAGLRGHSVTLAPAALLNAFFFHYPEMEGCTLILEIGARATNLLLVEAGRIFTRVIPLGGNAITQAVATDLQETPAGAETLKKAKGFVHPGGSYADAEDPVASRISKLARGVMTRLHTEVERSITFYRSQQGGGKPGLVLLAGGGALLPHTDLFFQDKLKIPARFFQPFRRLGVSGQGSAALIQRDFPAWASGIGAGLQALPSAPAPVNVLGTRQKDPSQNRYAQGASVVGIISLLLLLLLPGVHGFWQGAKLHGQLEERRVLLDQANLAVKSQADAKKNLEDTLRKMELVQVVEQRRHRWARLLEELRNQSEAGMWITRLEVKPGEPAPPGAAGRPTPADVVVLEGMFEARSREADARAVEEFRRKLEAGGQLRSVVIVEREAPREVDGRTDQVALTFRLRAEWPGETTSPAPPGDKSKKP